MKTCTKCKESKDEGQFYPKRKGTCRDKLMSQCKGCVKIINAERSIRFADRDKNYREKNKDRYNEWYLYHKGDKKEYDVEYRENNREKINTREKLRKQSDPLYKLKCDMRSSIWGFLKKELMPTSRKPKPCKMDDIIGMDYLKFKEHIQSLFKEGMNWNNHGRKDGQWQIDHIVSLSTAKTKEDVIKLCHYTNLQPLWAEENRTKDHL